MYIILDEILLILFYTIFFKKYFLSKKLCSDKAALAPGHFFSWITEQHHSSNYRKKFQSQHEKLNRYEIKHKQRLILNDYLLHVKLTVVSLVMFLGGSDEHSGLIKYTCCVLSWASQLAGFSFDR